MSTNRKPEPWEVCSWLSRRTLAVHWYARRRIAVATYEFLTNEAGRTKRFKSEAAARAAIAKATGGAS